MENLHDAINKLKQSYKEATEEVKSKMTPKELEQYNKIFDKLDKSIANFEKVDPAKLFDEIKKDLAKND
jgi:hypothetical protein